ncbi:PREDICTED: protodermal factor 1 [Theobroma cacao]|uniref:Protodermal factor 1 n=1 Tax=Theobroma cacao TaxID=3641 RepID=A0AB32VH87_THECC|nr:PREDICTED: protodermal factor 1 [Theobroma cacao]
MDLAHKLLLTALLIVAAALDGTQAAAMVSGTVFCDQCKDGQRSLFDYPLNGMKVTITCADGNGQVTMSREETTNLFGSYVMRFDGTPDLSNCYAQVSGSGQGSNGCGATAGPSQKLRLMFRMFGMEIYGVDSLLSQPTEPMSFCPRSANPVPAPRITPTRPSGPTAPAGSPPTFRLPPLPLLPPLPPLPPMPPLPFSQASACSHQYWTMPEYKCYWRVLNPESKVALIFGPLAARRYGTDMTLWESLQGRGDPYKTLLREGTTALLNSYNSLQFPYNSVAVVTRMNWALMGSTRGALITALRFIRANAGSGNVTCKLTPCK